MTQSSEEKRIILRIKKGNYTGLFVLVPTGGNAFELSVQKDLPCYEPESKRVNEKLCDNMVRPEVLQGERDKP